MAMQASRRELLKGAGSAAAALATSGPLSLASSPAHAADSVIAQIMKIPGAGNGSPTDVDWQKVGELCLGPTKANVQPGEFKGVELTFLGVTFQNLHNFMFRGFLKSWEAYTGAKLKWIDLSEDYFTRAAAFDRIRRRRLRHSPDARAARGRHGRKGSALGNA